MIGLFRKDVLVMRGVLKIYPIAMAVYAVLAWQGILSTSFLFTSASFFFAILPLSIFLSDEQARWERYAAVLPVGSKAVVGARYLFILNLFLMVLAVGLACSVVLWLTRDENLLTLTLQLIVSNSIQLLLPAVLMPICYKSGWEKARILLCVLLVVPLVALVLLVRFNFLNLSFLYALSPSALIGWAILLLLSGLTAMLVSYLISCRIVAEKEY